MANNRGETPTAGPYEAASYLTALLEELATLAKQSDLPVVAYLLDMALMEAKAKAGQPTEAPEPSRS